MCTADNRAAAPAACAAVALLAGKVCGSGWGEGGDGDGAGSSDGGACTAADAAAAAGGGGGAGVVVLRAAYSRVEGDAWIRPHAGPTNAQLKLHYGVIVPPADATAAAGAGAGAGAGAAYACRWWFNIGGERRQWVEREALLFDDSFGHEVYSECDAGAPAGAVAGERVVLQLVLRHPHYRSPSEPPAAAGD